MTYLVLHVGKCLVGNDRDLTAAFHLGCIDPNNRDSYLVENNEKTKKKPCHILGRLE